MRTTISIKEAKKKQLKMREDEVNKAVALAEQVSAFYPAEARVNVSEYEDAIHYAHMEVTLQHAFLELYISFGHTKKYTIGCGSLHSFKNLSNATVYGHSFEKPNEIGVLNAKKIRDWIMYYENVYGRALDLDKRNADKKAAFIDSLKGLPVRWIDKGKRGELIKNGIEYNFIIGEEYVSEKIELHYKVSATLEAFKLLSANEWK